MYIINGRSKNRPNKRSAKSITIQRIFNLIYNARSNNKNKILTNDSITKGAIKRKIYIHVKNLLPEQQQKLL